MNTLNVSIPRMASFYRDAKGNCTLCEKPVCANSLGLSRHLARHVKEGRLFKTIEGRTSRYSIVLCKSYA